MEDNVTTANSFLSLKNASAVAGIAVHFIIHGCTSPRPVPVHDLSGAHSLGMSGMPEQRSRKSFNTVLLPRLKSGIFIH